MYRSGAQSHVVLLLLSVALSAATLSNVHAEGCDWLNPRVWPYRIVLDAPPAGKPGESLTYRIDYGRMNEVWTEPFGFVFEWSEGATFESVRFLEGPPGVSVKQEANLVLWEFPGRPEAGAMEVVLKADRGFTGDIEVSVKYHRPGVPPAGSAEFQQTRVLENPARRDGSFISWMQHKVVLSGPRTAYSGDVVEYRIDYERTRSTGIPLGGLVFNWPQAAALVYIRPESEPSYMGPGSLTDLPVSDAESGSIILGIQTRPDFTGCLGVGWYVRGTGIMPQIGSVGHVQTEVVALPRAGDGG